MVTDYWDTSSLAKLYFQERGSQWSADRAALNEVVTSALTAVEIASVVRRRFREGTLTNQARDDLFARFLRDAVGFELIDVTREILSLSSDLVLAGGTGTRVRVLDAIQLATAKWWFEQARALTIEPGAFIVADQALREAAVALGMAVENPEDYA